MPDNFVSNGAEMKSTNKTKKSFKNKNTEINHEQHSNSAAKKLKNKRRVVPMKHKFFNFKLKETVFVLSILLMAISSHSQNQIRHYDLNCGSSGQDYGRSIINRIEGGYAIAGYTYHYPSCIGSYDWMFIKLKPSGFVDCVRIVGLTKDDKCYSVAQSLSDSGYVLAGYTTNGNSPYRKRATMTKLLKNCALNYSRAITDTLNSSYNQVVRDPANRWGFTGYQEHQVTVGYLRNKILATQYSGAGALVWGSKYVSPGLSTDEAQSICFQPVNGSYCLAVRTNYYTGLSGVYDVMLVKLDYAGAIVWKKVYKIVLPTGWKYPNTEPRKVIPMPDGGFAVVGFTNAYGSSQRDIFALRVNGAGSIMWSMTYGTAALFEQGESIAFDGTHLVITGSERTVSPIGSPNAFIMKIPAGGGAPLYTRRWDNTNPTDVGYDIIPTLNGTVSAYAVTGHTQRPAVTNDPFFWRTNTDGLIPPLTCYDSIITPWRTNAHRLDSFQLVRVQLFDVTRQCNEIIPTDLTTTLCLSVTDNSKGESDTEDKSKYSLNQNSPNPFNPTTTISYNIPTSGFTSIKVFDISGRLVSTLVSEYKETGTHNVVFDGSNLATGVYYYKLEADGFTDIKKMILIK